MVGSKSNEDEEAKVKRLFESYLSISSRDSKVAAAAEAGINFRFRPPFKFTNNLDARGDAILLILQDMTERGFPLWASNIVSRRFVDECSDQHNLARVPFDESSYKLLNAVEWCRAVTSTFEKYAQKYALGECALPIKPVEWDHLPFSLYSYKNRKAKMEDRHIVLPSLTVATSTAEEAEKWKADAFFAVFDGHNGAECAVYGAAHASDCLLEVLEKKSQKSELVSEMLRLLDSRLTLRCNKEHLKSGATACCAYISSSTAYLSWVGDSSIGVFRKNKVVTLSKRHLPSLKEERERIEAAGGMVLTVGGEPRVNGVLNVSRALGDIDGRPMISQEPDGLVYPLDNNFDYIMFLSSDGIWDTFNQTRTFELTLKFISTHSHDDYEKLAEYLGNIAIADGATDNLTMIVVYLDKPENVWKKILDSTPKLADD